MKKAAKKATGPRTEFGPKVWPAISILLTAEGRRRMEKACAHSGKSRGEVVENLLRGESINRLMGVSDEQRS